MARRKRMQYDPPHKRKKSRRESTSQTPERTTLSRRLLVMKAGVVGAFGTLAWRLHNMQILQGEEFQLEARKNVTKDVIIPAPRGLIVDRKGRSLAENRRAWEVRVVPEQLPSSSSEPEERKLVLDTLATALGLEDVLVIRPAAVPTGSVDLVYNRVATELGTADEDRQDLINYWKVQAGQNILVKVAGLSIDNAARFRSRLAEMPGVEVINEVEYLVQNIWAPSLPITIRTDVPRDVALRLEANLIYLPGVELDDNVLVRQYRGGEVMSHVLGYVQSIDNVSLKSPEYLDENKEPIYQQNDIIGREGLEQALEADLRGVKGRQIDEVDVNGVTVRTLREGVVLPKPGKNARLTIDLEFQQAVGKALERQITLAAQAKRIVNDKRLQDKRVIDGTEEPSLWEIPNSGAVVAFDPRNGEILAMVSYPYYDNQLFVTGISQTKFDEYLEPERGTPFLNRCTNELYPPGSTFKIFLAASALHHGALDVNQTHVCRGAIQVPETWDATKGPTFACWVGWIPDHPGHGELDLYDAIQRSCDIYFYNVAVSETMEEGALEPVYYLDRDLLSGSIVSNQKHYFGGLGIEPLAEDMQNRFWFGKPTEIEIVEAAGLFPDPAWKVETIGEQWTVGDTLNVSIGQGESKATPLHIALNTAALANGGKLYQPRLVKSRIDNEGEQPTAPRELGQLSIARDHIETVVEGMRRAVHAEGGTAYVNSETRQTKWPLTNPETAEEEILIAGKTGTAEFGAQDDLGARDTHAWFTCFAPLEDPEIAVSVVIEAGGEGSTFAVPVADEVLRAWFELTGRRPRGVVLDQNPLPSPDEPETGTPEATPESSPEA